jgi:alkylation response protein AidB-like acyl-CoA dehydrogenase
MKHLSPLHSDKAKDAASLFATLRSGGFLDAVFIRDTVEAFPAMFDLHVELGRSDLSMARLYEGHVNACQLIARFGSAEQVRKMENISAAGGALGVWGADDPSRPGRITGEELSGAKTYASGSHALEMAVVAVKNPEQKTQLLLLPRGRLKGRFNAAVWDPIGMQETDSWALDLSGLRMSREDLLGTPGLYEEQPFFGGGAIRFVAAQLGGALAVFDAARTHLQRTGRFDDPHQAARLAAMSADLEAAFAYIRQSYERLQPAIGWVTRTASRSDALVADSARIVAENTIERVTSDAMRCVGCGGLMDRHPLSKAVRDLLVYMRQPAPDAVRVRVGRNIGNQKYKANFDGG